MHDLLQKMAWEIVYHESPQKPGGRSRLWLDNDVFYTLRNNTVSGLVYINLERCVCVYIYIYIL